MDLAKLEARAFARDLVLIVARRAERHDGIQNGRRRAKCTRVQTNFFFPRLAVGMNGNFQAIRGVRLFARKIRRVFLGRLRLHFLGRIDFDERFGRGAELFVGREPHGAAEHFGSVVDRHGGGVTALAGRGVSDLVRVVQIVASHAHLRFEPPRMAFLTREQGSVRAHDFRAVRRGQDIADEICRRRGLGKNRQFALHLFVHGRDHGRRRRLGPLLRLLLRRERGIGTASGLIGSPCVQGKQRCD